MASIDRQLEAEIDQLVRRLNRISADAKKESQQAFKIASPTLISAIQAGAPVSAAPHSRYRDGKIVATYEPGNLRRSFRALTFRRSAAVFVGPKLGKSSGGHFSGNKVDGYYAHWMEYGAPAAGIAPRPFVRPAVGQVGARTLQIAVAELKKKIAGI